MYSKKDLMATFLLITKVILTVLLVSYNFVHNIRSSFGVSIIFSLNFLLCLGHEYPAIVEFAPNQKIPKKSRSHKDAKNGTIDEDTDYLKFLEQMENPVKSTRTIQQCLEDIDAKEKELKSMFL